MEQSSGSSTVTDEDMMVAAILLELPGLISQSQSLHRFAFAWGSKGKRSTSKSKLAAASLPTLRPSPPPSQHQSSPPSAQPSKVIGSTYATMGPLEKALTSSPSTPFSFPPSESDEKPLPPPKRKPHVNNLRKKKEQLLEIMEDFSRRNELLKKEIESKKRFYDQQTYENIELKSKKLKISMEPGNSSSRQNWRMDETNPQRERNKKGEYPMGGMMICWDNCKLNDNVGPLGLIDLNVSAEEAAGALSFGSSVPFDLETATKARAAQARLIRKQICRSKNYNNSARY